MPSNNKPPQQPPAEDPADANLQGMMPTSVAALERLFAQVVGINCALVIAIQNPRSGVVHVSGNITLPNASELLKYAKQDVDEELLKQLNPVGPMQ